MDCGTRNLKNLATGRPGTSADLLHNFHRSLDGSFDLNEWKWVPPAFRAVPESPGEAACQ